MMILFTLLAVFMAFSHGFIMGFMAYHLLADRYWREASSIQDRLGFVWIMVFNLAGLVAWTYAIIVQFLSI